MTRAAGLETITELEADYRGDFHAWAFEQARLLRAGEFDRLDIENLAEEVESLGRSSARNLYGHLARLLQHMLKWDYQPAHRSRSWLFSIRVHRKHVAKTLAKNPSLKSQLDELVGEAFELAALYAEQETGLGPSDFPDTCPYDWADIMEREFALEPDEPLRDEPRRGSRAS